MGAEQSRSGAVAAGAVPPGVSTIGPNLQKRFAKGIQYNMKVVIKGDRNVGKTCLFHRLQGHAFKEEYIPTPEIQVACIQWNYKVTDDVVKVEIWDIVDKGKTKKREGLKMDNSMEDTAPTLDAEFIDVYKGTSGVIMMLDITKYWTYEYVQRELPKVPLDIPVIVMASHRDMEDTRSVLSEDVQAFLTELNRPSHAAAVYYMEASMQDGFGLKYLYRFFNVPFLELQRQTLIAQLRRNEEDLEAIKVELDVHEKTEEQDYDRFREALERKRKGLPATGVCTVSAGANETAEPSQGADVSGLEDGATMSLRSRLSPKVLQNTPLPAKITAIDSTNQRIDNFVPEGRLDTSFLDGGSTQPSPKPRRARLNEVDISDSDDDVPANPQVTQDQESPDEDDMVVVHKPQSESEEEEEEEEVVVMADDDLPEPVTLHITPVKRAPAVSPTIVLAPLPPQAIDPIAVARVAQPITDDAPCDVAPHDVVVHVAPHDAETTSSITSLEDLTISDTAPPAPVDTAPPASVDTAPPAPYIDLDVLEKISTAPPITQPPIKQTKGGKSPKIKKKKETRKLPPKKSLLDIQLTSSEEEEEGAEVEEPPQEEQEQVEVLGSYEEPRTPAKRQQSSGSLKLTHAAYIPTAEPEPPQIPLVSETTEKRRVKNEVRREKNEERREKNEERREKDELDEFFGEEVREKKRKPKKKKKKKGAPAGALPKDGDYEQF